MLLMKRTLLGLCAFLFSEPENAIVHGFVIPSSDVRPPPSQESFSFSSSSLLFLSSGGGGGEQSTNDDSFQELGGGNQSAEEEANNNNNNNNIRFLGKGPNAIVRPGAVLVAPSNEFHHYYRQAAIFIYAMGEDEDYDNTYVIRGAILDMPTPFTLGEMAESTILQDIRDNPMESNLIYRGGDKGGDHVFMLHNQQSVGGGTMIGTSGVYQGGLHDALRVCKDGTAKAEDFKFFFNFCQFTEDELESMLEDDPWISVEVPTEYVLSTEWDKGDCWKQLRNALKQQHQQTDE